MENQKKQSTLQELIQKVLNRETVTYVIVGFATTAVDYLVFALVNELMKRGGSSVETSSTVATAVAWLVAVLFAYLANKVFVFRSYNWKGAGVLKEMAGFFGARIASGLITVALMRLFVGLGMNEYIAKIFTSVFNLVFNYVASKLFIFKKV